MNRTLLTRASRVIRERLTYANVLASVAVFAALGGGAYAAHTHRMGTQDLQNRAVTAAKLRPQAVGTGRLKDGAVNDRKLAGVEALEASHAVPVNAPDPSGAARERTIVRSGPIELFGRCETAGDGEITGAVGVRAFPEGSTRHRIAVSGPDGGFIGNGGSSEVIEVDGGAGNLNHDAGELAITVANTDEGRPRLRQGYTGAGGVGIGIDGADRCYFNATLIGG